MKIFIALLFLLFILSCNDSLDDKNISCKYSECPNQYYCNAAKTCVKGVVCSDINPCNSSFEDCVGGICIFQVNRCIADSDCSAERFCDKDINFCVDMKNPCNKNDGGVLCSGNRICINNITLPKKYVCECFSDFTEENGKCINEKLILCNSEIPNMPSNSKAISVNVVVTYNPQTKNWNNPKLCDWGCINGYDRVADFCQKRIESCRNEVLNKENNEVCDGSADNGLDNFSCRDFCMDATPSNNCDGYPKFNDGFLSCEPTCLGFNTELCRADKIYDILENDRVKSLFFDKENNLYVAGETNGSIRTEFQNSGSSDIFLIKYDRDRKELWRKQWGTSAVDLVFSIEVDQNGYVFVFGGTQGLFLGSGVTAGDRSGDIFLTRLDKNGNIEWIKQWGSHDSTGALKKDEAKDMKLLPEYLLILGNTSGFFIQPEKSTDSDIFLAKINPINGELIGVFKLFRSETSDTENFNDSAQKMVVIDDLIYIVGGTDGKIGDNIQQNIGGNDTFLLVVNRHDFQKKWVKQWGSQENDIAYSITQYENDLYIGGNTKGELEIEEQKGETDVFLLKCSPTTQCTSPTIKQFGTTFSEYLNSILINDMGIHLIGNTTGKIGERNFGESDFFIINRYHDLTENWNQQWGKDKNDFVLTSKMDENSRIYIGGSFGFNPNATNEESVLSSFGITIK